MIFKSKSNTVVHNSVQFRKYLIACFFAITAQLRAMKWRKRMQPLRAIPRNGIPIGNPKEGILNYLLTVMFRGTPYNL